VLVSSASETAFAVRDELDRRHARATDNTVDNTVDGTPARHKFMSSGDVEQFARLARRLLGPEVVSVEPWRLGATS
jgi:hypothetical protein